MSGQLHRSDNGEQDINLLDSLQRAAMERLDSIARHVREKSNQPNQHEQPSKSCESDKCTCDPGSNATCACTGATPRAATCGGTTCGGTACTSSTNNGGAATSNSIIGRHFNTTSVAASSECNTVTDYIERDYAEYLAATSAKGQGASAWVRNSVESRNFKQADADSGDSIERRIGIPAGVTI